MDQASQLDQASQAGSRWNASQFRRVVVKLGSAVITTGGRLDDAVLCGLADQFNALMQRGIEVVVVSSGAVACGLEPMGLVRRPKSIVEQQAAAAAGQSKLVEAWSRALLRHGLSTAQILLTAEDTADRRRFLNARRTFDAVISRGLVPIVNENDAVSFDEIKFGDNDRLSALVTQVTHADLLVLLSTVAGLMAGTQLVSTVSDLGEVSGHVRSERSATGVGGMAAKLQAASLAASWGVPVVIAGGREQGILCRILDGEQVGTLVVPSPSKAASRKRWIGASSRSRGRITIDEGAEKALGKHASLLPAGVLGVDGEFESGDTVDVCTSTGTLMGRGLVSYGSAEIATIMGCKSSEIIERLGYMYTPEIIHRDSFALTQTEQRTSPRTSSQPVPGQTNSEQPGGSS
jgi:glutamate 5-kinase